MKDTISQVLKQCLREFTALTDSDILNHYETEVPRRRWLDELGRLRVWSGNVGAHQMGQSSLDYRLRDASHLKDETIKLLGRMLRVLQEVVDVMTEEGGEKPELELDSGSEDENTTEVQQLHQSVVDIINSLFQISMAIRRPADHDRVLNMRIKDELYFEPWARQHVSNKYPNAEDSIISRLSAALSRQRAILKYRERHRAKLEKGLFERIETESTKLSETVATDMAPDNDQLYFLERQSNSGISQSSYATSLMDTKAATSIPNPPKGSENSTPFECPYCFHVIIIKYKKDWVQHVFRDLMPYVCLASNCTTPLRLYESRHQWSLHLFNVHAGTPWAPDSPECPLCHLNVEPSSFEKHVGRHLEELALFILPRPEVTEKIISESSSSAVSEALVDNENDDPGFPGTGDAESLFDLSGWARQSVGELEDILAGSEEGQDPEFDAGYDLQQSRLDINLERVSEGGLLPFHYLVPPPDSPSARAYEPGGSAPSIQDDLLITSRGTFQCPYEGCTASPFKTNYLLKSHFNVHFQERPHYCPVEGCSRGPGGLGFKRKNDMVIHRLVHGRLEYICPFCPFKSLRRSNFLRHVNRQHPDKRKDDPNLRRALLGQAKQLQKPTSMDEPTETLEASEDDNELSPMANTDKSEKSIAEGRTQFTSPNPHSEKRPQSLGAEVIQQLEEQKTKE